MPATRRLLECGHIQRVSSIGWRKLAPEDRRKLLCSSCHTRQNVIGPVTNTWAPPVVDDQPEEAAG